MKFKALNGYGIKISTGETFISYQNWVIKGFGIDLGNNYTMGHFVDTLPESVKDFIHSNINCADSVRLVGSGHYGKCTLNTCGHDLMDFLR